MKFIANRLNNTHLRDILPPADREVDSVLAAIAYGGRGADEKESLVRNCLAHGVRLDIWMRYDHTVPVSVPILQFLLKNQRNNIFCKLIPDRIHSKVIWWKGYGAYIGSANLTDSAWLTNIEAGMFLDEDDLNSNGMLEELENFFGRLDGLDVAFPLTQDVILEMEKFVDARKGLKDVGREDRSVPFWAGPDFETDETAKDKRKEVFRREWHDALGALQAVRAVLEDYQPAWLSKVPPEWHADQFLHAYYYNRVSEGHRRPYEEFHLNNKNDPAAALNEAAEWWASQTSPPSNEDETLFESAPFLREHLKEDRIAALTLAEFEKVCNYTHATKDHVIKMKGSTLGRKDGEYLSFEERVPLYAKYIYEQRNELGWDILELLKFVLYGGEEKDIWERIYIAAKSPDYRIKHYGLNSIGELAGWARPEVTPPRNGRTSKALRALGYSVSVY